MKSCPFCAEEIQDAAIVCKHCHRELGGKVQNAQKTDAPPKKRLALAVPLLAAALLAVGGLIYSTAHQQAPSVRQQGLARALPRPPIVISIASTSDIDVDAGAIQRFDFTVPDDQPHCHLTGRVEVTSGGNRDVKVFVATTDEYINWVNGHEAKVLLATDKTTIQNLDLNFVQSGKLVLALSNTFSTFSGKRVQLRNVRATCT